MTFQTPLKITEVIENIHARKYLLPSIQREVVWDTDRMVRLFDSLMRDYPVGSFLFWYVTKQKSKEFQFYEFVRDFHQRDHRHNDKANISGDDDITAILDGQQRLTSLYIGLKGTYAEKLPRMRVDNNLAYPEKRLYLNLLKESKELDLKYDFRFLTEAEAKANDDDNYWFKVGQILDMIDGHELSAYLIENGLSSKEKEKSIFASKTLFQLHSVVHRNLSINYYLEKNQDLDVVLNIFIRVNSGGEQLSYSDLLLSIASAQWKDRDARDEITKFVDGINKIGNGFNINKDFVLKSCLVLSDFKEIAFKAGNFNKANMLQIEKSWPEISQAISLAINLVSALGYDRDTLSSNNAVIPIAYYLLKKSSPNNFVQSSLYASDRNMIQIWLIHSLLKRAFSGQPDSVLIPIRDAILSDHASFPFEKIVDEFKGKPTKSIVFNLDEIENLFTYEYGGPYTFSAMAPLYLSLDFKNKFHQDHIHPKSVFTRSKLLKRGISEADVEFYLNNYNSLANLQLLDGTQNEEKSSTDFREWLLKTYPIEDDRKDYMRKNYIPDVDHNLTNFKEFIIKRKELLFQKYKEILKL
jgi:uncharacterized protein with ParB-like and HNH nuclease domain